MTTNSQTWRSVDLPFGVTLDVPATGTPSEGATGEMKYFLLDASEVRIGAWTGGVWSLAHWRALVTGRRGQLGPEQPVTVCGRAATRQEADVPADEATGLVRGEDGAIGHIYHEEPAQVRVALAVDVGGAPVVIEWAVAAGERATHRTAEDHFFASIRCR